ncbi:MAG: Gfo/Idh/MocA family oxidoreductase [Planctomycetia bacterium]|nr:Gfo/Idh/MocA family oxidoreductase [Planctomycetia bacterium]
MTRHHSGDARRDESSPTGSPSKQSPYTLSRRQFLSNSARVSAAGAALLATGVWSELPAAESKSPNEKLDVACIGTANRAGANVQGVSSQNIVAICDVDDNYLGACGQRFPKATKYNDFRKLLETEKHLDAVVVSTPDHIHVPASVMAMRLGKHCYCEKPLAHSVTEARLASETAREHKVATQMGIQIHEGDNYRRVVELIQSGAIGPVSEVHVWVGKGWGGGDRPKEGQQPPANLHWDLWLGPAPERPFAAGRYHPANWRRWWDFGSGTLGDMACHYMDLPFWALQLKHPTSIEAEGPPVHPETCPLGLIVRYEFPGRDSQPPVKLTWYDGNMVPRQIAGHATGGGGVLFIGADGKQLWSDYGRHQLLPADKFQGFKPPAPTIPNSIGHYNEWIKACKEGTPTTCSFEYSGPLTEAVLLGNVAYRAGKKLAWDGNQQKVTNTTDADPFLKRAYRPGWTL